MIRAITFRLSFYPINSQDFTVQLDLAKQKKIINTYSF